MIVKKNKLAIFDLDGTLFDTKEVNYYSYKEALYEYEIFLDKDYFIKECNGRHYKNFLPNIMGNNDFIDDVHNRKKILYSKYLDKSIENKHLFNIIKSIKDEYYISLVTTASRKNTIEILTYFNKVELFDYIVTQEDITKTKPDPQGFLLAMRHFDVNANNTIIFEDSNVGIEAARLTGSSVFIIDQFN